MSHDDCPVCTLVENMVNVSVLFDFAGKINHGIVSKNGDRMACSIKSAMKTIMMKAIEDHAIKINDGIQILHKDCNINIIRVCKIKYVMTVFCMEGLNRHGPPQSEESDEESDEEPTTE